MKKSKKNIILISIISIFLIIFNLFIKQKFILYAESIAAAFMIIIIFLSIQMYGFQKDKNSHIKKSIFIKITEVLIAYFIVIYLLGLYFGYSKIVFSLKLSSIINNTFAPIIIFLCLELFRYILINNNKDNKKLIVLFNSIIGIIELSVTTRYLHFYDLETTYKSIADHIIPVAVKQLSLGYICYYGGLKSTLLYRIIMVLYTYIVPIHPNFSKTLICVCNILLPILLLTSANDIVDAENKEKIRILPTNNRVEKIVAVTCTALFILIVSGISPVGITAVASDSMHPTFDKGAGVITLKVKEESIKKGDIISFKKNNRKTIHRIDKIEIKDKEIRYYTKGDFNSSLDPGYITYEDIDSKVILSVPLIGYPSLIIGELLSK